jgi:hypothetical protein
MNAYAIMVLAVLPATAALPQGLLDFANLEVGVNAPIYDIDGTTPLAGPGFLAGLYAAPVGQSLAPVGGPVPFLTTVPGYFRGGSWMVPGVPAGHTAVLQVVAWRASDGPTYALANHPGAHVGSSDLLEVPLAGGAQPPSALIGLQSFSLHEVVPEPSVFALGLSAGCAATWRRGPHRRAKTKLSLDFVRVELPEAIPPGPPLTILSAAGGRSDAVGWWPGDPSTRRERTPEHSS